RTRDLTLELPSFTLLTPFPATGFYNEMKEKGLLLTEVFNKFNWLNPVIKTPNFNSEVLKKLLFLGFYANGFYAGNLSNKITLVKRTIKLRGYFYVLLPTRIYRTIIAYFKWKKIVLNNLKGFKKKNIKQIRSGNLKQMKELK
ncbi:unnamed protein product, partial [marine sediment metagenome]